LPRRFPRGPIQLPMADSNNGKIGPLLTGDSPLPHSLEAERAVLSCLLQDAPGTLDLAFGKLKSEASFYHPSHRKIFAALGEMRGEMVPSLIDFITITDRLERQNALAAVGGEDYLSSLLNAVPTTANIEKYVDCVLDAFILRRMISVCSDIVGRCYEGGDDVPELIDRIEQDILDVTEMRTDSHAVALSELITGAVDYLNDLSEQKPETMGLQTGFRDVDRLITGLRDGELIVLAARPSVGKTALALNIARNVALHPQHPKAVGLFSMEMGCSQLVIRLLCSEARINIKDVRDGRLTQAQWGVDIMRACDLLHAAPIYIDDMPQLASFELRQKARRMKQDHDVRLIIIDYLQLMRPSGGNRSTSREQEVARLSREIKSLAKELGLPIMLLCQLNRQAEQAGGRPRLSHLRESGAIEQDADIVAILHRERDGDADQSPDVVAKEGIVTELIIAKNRNGETGIRKLTFFPPYTCFKDFTGISDEDVPAEARTF